MKRYFLLLFLICLMGCSTSLSSSSISSSNSTSSIDEISSSEVSSSSTSNKDTSSSSGTSSYPFSYSSSNIPLTVLSIQEVIEKCLLLPSPEKDNLAKFVQGTELVKIHAHALSYCNNNTTKSGYGPDGKILMVDSTGYIYVSGSSKENFYQQACKYINKDTSNYEITGYVAMSRGQPELVLQEYVWNENLDINYDLSTLALPVNNIEEIYDEFYKLDYNIKGTTSGGFVSNTNITCLSKLDDNMWNFIDDNNRTIKVRDCSSNTSFSLGVNYDIIGSLSISKYSPCLMVGSYSRSIDQENKNSIDIDNTTSITFTELNKTHSNYSDDTYDRVSEKVFYSSSYIYNIDCYVNAYNIDGYKYYFTLGENSCELSSEISAASANNVFISNNSMHNVKDASLNYVPLLDEYNNKTQVKLFFILDSEKTVNKIKCWNVHVIESLIQ